MDAWLAKKYGQRLATFERNDETLQALLHLATLNDGADEQRALVERVERTALQSMLKRVANEDGAYSTVLRHLSTNGRSSLDTLAKVAVSLRSTDLATMCDRFSDLVISHFDAYEQIRQMDAQQHALKREQARLDTLLHDLKDDALQAPENVLEQTNDWTRDAKHLRAKVVEYDERLSSFRAQSPASPKMEHLAEQMTDLKAQRARLASLTGMLSTFQSLPSDLPSARVKIESARNELAGLMKKRDRLFEGLVED